MISRRREVNASLERMQNKQKILRETSFADCRHCYCFCCYRDYFIFMITRDISKSKYYRMQLEKAKQYAEDLLHSREKMMLTISHDIRAPLSSIIGYIDLCYGGIRMKGNNITWIICLVRPAISCLWSMTCWIFTVLNPEKWRYSGVAFSVSALFNEIFTSFRPIAESKDLTFVLNLKRRRNGKVIYR